MTTTKLTEEYIKEHPAIQSCLKKGLINYSSLSRMIAKDLKIEKKTSMEAILIAARRYADRLKREKGHEKKIRDLLSNSEMEIKNKIVDMVIEKIDFESLQGIEEKIMKAGGTFYVIEGSAHYSIITQEKFLSLINKKIKNKIIKINKKLALINFISPKDIEQVKGVVSYLTSLFAENDVNIVEFLSCWTDTLFVIETKDANRAMGFLRF